MAIHVHVHQSVRDAVTNNSDLERANRLIEDIRQRAAKIRDISGDLGSDRGTIDDARRALSHIRASVISAMNLIERASS